MSRGPAYGFCPYENMLLNASVSINDRGSYVLAGSRTMKSADPFAECIFTEYRFMEECWISVPTSARVLTDQDAAELQQRLAGLPTRDCGSDDGACDPCIVTELVFDDRRATRCCAFDESDSEFNEWFSDIEALLDAIAAEE